MIENPVVSGEGFEEQLSMKPIGTCHYKYCDETIYKNDGFEFEGWIYCCTSCVAEQLLEEDAIVDLSA